jgi:hypothetical protein
MANNPLQKYFRQPKIYIRLPSQGVYNVEGSIQGDVTKIPVYGMTGMDEILAKTPDALLTGESTVKIIESCCPNIKNAWDVSALDADLIFSAIRIATYGNDLTLLQTCPHCSASNEYTLDLNKIIEHFGNCNFDSKVVLDEIVIKIQPLNYKKKTEYALRNFQIQQKLSQVEAVENDEQKRKLIVDLFKEMGAVQHSIFIDCVESVEVDNKVVTERPWLKEWLDNCDKSIFDSIKAQIEKNQAVWAIPVFSVDCVECHKPIAISVDLDQSSFFV